MRWAPSRSLARVPIANGARIMMCGGEELPVLSVGHKLDTHGRRPRRRQSREGGGLEQSGARTPSMMHPILKRAAESGLDALIRRQLQNGVPVDALDEDGRTILMLAARGGHRRTCKFLLEVGARVDLRDASGVDALGHATDAKQTGVVLLLLEHNQSQPVPKTLAPTAAEPDPVLYPVFDNFWDDGGWEEEGVPSTPAHDQSALQGAEAVQAVLSAHTPVDRDEDWTDVRVQLPIARPKQEAAQMGLLPSDHLWRRFFSSALHAGWVSEHAIDTVAEAQTDHEPDVARDLIEAVLEDFDVVIEAFPPWPGTDAENVPAALARGTHDAVLRFRGLEDDRKPVHRRFQSKLYEGRLGRAGEDRLARAIAAGQIATFAAVANSTRLREHLSALLEEAEEHGHIDDGDEGPEQGAPVRSGAGWALLRLAKQVGVSTDFDIAAVRTAVSKARTPLRALVRAIQAEPDPHPLAKSLIGAFDAWQVAWAGLVCSHLRFAVDFSRKVSRGDTPFEDVVQEACIGLMIAADRLDHRRGFAFATYSVWWIRARTFRFVDQSTLVHGSAGLLQAQRTLGKVRNRLERGGVAVAPEELAIATGLTIETVVRAVSTTFEFVTLPDGDDDEAPWTGHEAVPSPEENAADRQLLGLVRGALDVALTARELKVLNLRYGLTDGEDRTLSEIGMELKLSRERIRQIEQTALGKLRLTAAVQELLSATNASTAHA